MGQNRKISAKGAENGLNFWKNGCFGLKPATGIQGKNQGNPMHSCTFFLVSSAKNVKY